MIQPHTVLTDVFSRMPLVNGYKANYKWGDEWHLNKLIKLYQNESKNPYPMIYNVSNTYTAQKKGYILYNPISLVIMTRNENVDWHNGNRWETSYKNYLLPTLTNILEAFRKSTVFHFDENNATVREFPNYGNGDTSELTDIVDAVRLDARVVITNNCYIPFEYGSI